MIGLVTCKSMAKLDNSKHELLKDPIDIEYDLSVEPWELNEVRKDDIVLKSNVSKCVVCGVGDVVKHKRGVEREAILVYGRNGTYSASHEEYICNIQNKYKPCRVSYYHGY